MTEERGWEEGGERSAQREKEGNEERSGGGAKCKSCEAHEN